MRVRVSRVKSSNYFRSFEKWWCETCRVLLSNNSFEWRMWHFRESKHTWTPRKYFQGSWLPNPRSTPLYITVTKNAFYVFLSSTTTDRFVESILFVCLFVWLSVCIAYVREQVNSKRFGQIWIVFSGSIEHTRTSDKSVGPELLTHDGVESRAEVNLVRWRATSEVG